MKKSAKKTNKKNKGAKTNKKIFSSKSKNRKIKTVVKKKKALILKKKAKAKVTKKSKVVTKRVKQLKKTKSLNKSKMRFKSATKKKVLKKTKKNKIVTKPRKSFFQEQVVTFGPIDVLPYITDGSEEYMNEKQTQHFRDILLSWKEQLIDEVGRTMQQIQSETSNYPDPVDRASQEEEFSLELRARDRERKLLRKIEDALIRINENSYGFCNDCGAEIGLRRLEARPTATKCIECKTIAEIKEKQIGEEAE